MPDIRPFQQVSEYDKVNLFAFSGTIPASKGLFVKIVGNGFLATNEPSRMIGNVGAAYANTVSQRYGVHAQVIVAGTGDIPLGLLLHDVREFDENGEKLVLNPLKQKQMQCVISGQAVPIATKGIFLYSGIDGTPVAGATAYAGANGGITCTGGNAVGRFLGTKDTNGIALIKVDL